MGPEFAALFAVLAEPGCVAVLPGQAHGCCAAWRSTGAMVPVKYDEIIVTH
ncbi:hypothetical protein LVY72_05625 [Arthrobacter sp. I2-34]|uniref:Uncharacterized protein n=1 Tax=Arthrobacter hankyongi TaxID=2904801 RepID=A0ABS9L3X4_9MICC|nr:hypothetical protein [Arthrobacter hankyongi]MCG2621394.1 hypothetical protein [Arthrobacter hankyongi]